MMPQGTYVAAIINS